jgi:uncharacterized membrane protein YqiK
VARSWLAGDIDKKLVLQTREIDLERQTEMKRAEQRKQVEIARQDMQIAIAIKSREQSEADAAARFASSKSTACPSGQEQAAVVLAARLRPPFPSKR